MPMTALEMIKLLKKNGFKKASQNGLHVKFYNKKTGKTTIVPMHRCDLPKGTEQVILKEAGLKK